MINKIHIKNYQSLQNLELELGKFTVIVGESDSGKSALIRALNGWATNQSGSEFTTHGKSSTAVAVELNGDVVIWHKPKNSYVINGKEYAKAGRECPAEVRAVTGFIDVVFDEDYSDLLNIANQFDPPFLVTLSGTKVAKVIGKISGIEFLYNAQRLAAREIATTKSQITSLEILISSLNKQLEEFAGIDEQRETLERIKKAFKIVGSEKVAIESLQHILNGIADWDSYADEFRRILDATPDVSKIDFELISSKLESIRQVELLVHSIEAAKLAVEYAVEGLKQAQGQETTASLELDEFWDSLDMCPLCERALGHVQLQV